MENGDKNYCDVENPKEEGYKLLKRIFLNLFIVSFIIISYFYFSESIGSISTYFVIDQNNVFQFGFTLLFFIFLSILAGPIHGAIAGFLGELLYQIGYYDNLEIHWCLIVALIGFFMGLYKYKPLKYKRKIKLLYTSLLLETFSIIICFFIILLEAIIHPISSLEVIFSNYGLKFLLQFIVTIPLIIPLLLFSYDHFLADKEYHFYNMTLTHHEYYACDHTFYLKFGRTYIYFCSRCSGTLLGAISTVFVMYIFERTIDYIITPEIALIICIVFPIPCVIDWGIQRLSIRESNTISRLITGFIIGMSLSAISFGGKYSPIIIFLMIFYLSIVGLFMYIGYKIEMKNLNKEHGDISSEDDILIE
ncbi:MAG: DUF2085 domain-containing protein [Candidatus Lokiarchaeota archaeon]|nr:DUF2085 domain-containing protein [Candidatus Lokiarchaeota archaeon]